MSYFIGLDLGGTAVKGGLIDGKGKVVGEIIENKLKKPISTTNVIETLVETAKTAISKAGKKLDDVISIGIGSPGLLDYEKGIVKKAANFPGFENVPIIEQVSKALGNKPAVLECDATAAAAAELWVGAGARSDIKSLVLITLGTGIGSGIVIDRQIVHGVGMAGEIGHTIVETDPKKAIPCGCGAKGCLERYASASSMELRTKEGLQSYHESTTLRELKEIKCPDIFKAAKNGDKYAQLCVDNVASYLGQAVVNLCRVIDPQLIVFAGGLAKAGPALLDKIKEYYKKYNWTLDHPAVEMVQTAVHKESAGVVGAAYAAKLLVEKKSKARL